MNKVFKIIGSILLVYIVVFSCNKLASRKLVSDINHFSSQQEIDPKSEIRQTTDMINREMPIKVDEQTTVVKAEYQEKENKFILYYKVMGIKRGEKSTEELDSMIQSLKSSQLVTVKNHPNNKTFVKEKVTLEYIYKDVNDSVLFSYQITPNEYN